MPAPRIGREEFLNLPMMTDHKLALKAFDEHAWRGSTAAAACHTAALASGGAA
jgi:hypothetical protein